MQQPSRCICTNLRRGSRVVTQLYDTLLAPSGLKVTQFSLLRAIQRSAPVSLGALADEVRLERTTLARNLRLLEQAGLVTITPGADQRVRIIALTAAGVQAIAAALPLWEQAQAQVGELLGQERLQQLTSLLQLVEELAG